MRIVMEPPAPGRAFQFQGVDHGGADVSFFVNRTAPGKGPSLHRHEYHEVFVIHEGHVEVVSTTRRSRRAAARSSSCHRGSGMRSRTSAIQPLLMVSIHPVAEMVTEWPGASVSD